MNKQDLKYLKRNSIEGLSREKLLTIPEHNLHLLIQYHKDIKLTVSAMKSRKRHDAFWNEVNNITTIITWLVILPFAPIIYIIQTIKGECNK